MKPSPPFYTRTENAEVPEGMKVYMIAEFYLTDESAIDDTNQKFSEVFGQPVQFLESAEVVHTPEEEKEAATDEDGHWRIDTFFATQELDKFQIIKFALLSGLATMSAEEYFSDPNRAAMHQPRLAAYANV